MTLLSRSLALVATAGGIALGQEPTKPDTARRPVPTLPAVETKAPREERTNFEQKPNVGTITITGSDLTSAPRFFGEADILRAVRLLPGVTARNDYSVGMNVRGGEADQNLVLLDGYPIYNPFHMGGLFGAFVEPMVDRVDFMTGAFPARYGGRLSSVLDVSSKTEPRDGIHGRADVSFIATTLALGSGMQQGRGTWTVAVRRTYMDKAADLYRKGSVPYHFGDLQAHVVRALPGDWKWSVTAYDNVDDLLESSLTDDSTAYNLNWGNRLLGTTLSHTFVNAPRLFGVPLGDSARLVQRLSTSRFRVDMNFFASALMLHNVVHDQRVSGALESYDARHTRAVGYELGFQRFAFDANYPLLLYPSDTIANRNTIASVYYDDLWRPSDRWLVQSGVRLDAISGIGRPVVQPRVSVKYFVRRELALTAAVGAFAQSTHSLSREDVPIRALDFWVGSAQAGAPMSRAWHYVAGVERWLSPSRALRVEGFFKQYGSLVEQNPYSDRNVSGDEFLTLHGRSFGGDLMLRQFGAGPFAGWIAYSFAMSSRVDTAGRRFHPGQDRAHELNVVSSWIGPRYTLSARFNLATGTPYTPVLGNFDRTNYNPLVHAFESDPGFTQFLVGDRNSRRLPVAHRVDVSLKRDGHVGRASVSPYLSIMNAYNAKNVFAYVFDYTATPPTRTGIKQFPVFPTIGVSIVW